MIGGRDDHTHSLFTRRNINAALTAECCRDVMPRVLLDFQSGTGDLRKVFQNRQESGIKHWDITNVSDFENTGLILNSQNEQVPGTTAPSFQQSKLTNLPKEKARTQRPCFFFT